MLIASSAKVFENLLAASSLIALVSWNIA